MIIDGLGNKKQKQIAKYDCKKAATSFEQQQQQIKLFYNNFVGIVVYFASWIGEFNGLKYILTHCSEPIRFRRK